MGLNLSHFDKFKHLPRLTRPIIDPLHCWRRNDFKLTEYIDNVHWWRLPNSYSSEDLRAVHLLCHIYISTDIAKYILSLTTDSICFYPLITI